MKTMSEIEMAPVILFDLDGTLVDSAVDLLNALNVIVQQTGKSALSLAQIRPVVSKGARAMLAVAFPALDEESRLQYLQPFLDCYQEAVAKYSTPFADIETVLIAIEASGSRWGIVTNKPFYLAREVVHSMGWTHRTAVLIGGDTLPRKKPDPDQLFHACELLAVQAADCIYVGDDERDVLAARHAGMKSVAALWGYREAHDDPKAWKADVMAAAPLDLLNVGTLLV
ncbi:MAG: phosphoglycolate phosphatase [Arenimonas sp.]